MAVFSTHLLVIQRLDWPCYCHHLKPLTNCSLTKHHLVPIPSCHLSLPLSPRLPNWRGTWIAYFYCLWYLLLNHPTFHPWGQLPQKATPHIPKFILVNVWQSKTFSVIYQTKSFSSFRAYRPPLFFCCRPWTRHMGNWDGTWLDWSS